MYTRVYTESSPRKLVSGKGPRDDDLSPDELGVEFLNHSDRQSQQPTRLVSVSSRIVDTITRAVNECYRENEPAAEVWIVFIAEPAHIVSEGDTILVHHAEKLARLHGLEDPERFRYEHLFEGSIPESLVVHRVSLETLLSRRLDQYVDIDSILEPGVRSTAKFRALIAEDIWDTANGSSFWDVGIYMGSVAQLFGARAPIHWIAYRLFFDCVTCTEINDDEDYYWLRYHGRERESVFELMDLKSIKDGVDTVLIDWWLTSDELVTNYETYKEQQCEVENNISVQIEEFYDTCYDEALDERQHELCDRARSSLLNDIARQRAVVEREAVKMGL
ncbi:hypothetical protein G7054_g13623 [Neopestalotiopsis clavispora]|nr:hypothetical protein G7054_g13623 [Neopestalotiopsis clavispora]